MSNKIPFHVRIPRWLRDRLKEYAASEAKSMNKAVTDILKERFSGSVKKVAPLSKNVQ